MQRSTCYTQLHSPVTEEIISAISFEAYSAPSSRERFCGNKANQQGTLHRQSGVQVATKTKCPYLSLPCTSHNARRWICCTRPSTAHSRDHGDCGEPTRFEFSRRLTLQLLGTPSPLRSPTRGDGKTGKSATTQSGLK